jgi:hypothetical protein
MLPLKTEIGSRALEGMSDTKVSMIRINYLPGLLENSLQEFALANGIKFQKVRASTERHPFLRFLKLIET